MAKGKFAKKLLKLADDVAVKADDVLDMSDAARLQRAKNAGFDIDTRYIHESPSEIPLQEIHGEGRFGGIFSLPDERAGYYKNVQEFFLKNEPFDDSDVYSVARDKYDDVSKMVRDMFGDVDVDEYIDYVATFDNIPPDLIENSYADLQKLRAGIAKLGGAESVIQPDEFGKSVRILGGPGVRNVNAVFDPAKKESSNLLASTLAGTAVAGAALSPDKAQAFVEPKGNFAKKLVGDYVQTLRKSDNFGLPTVSDRLGAGRVQTIEAPKNEWAAQAADWFDRYNKARKERLHPVADMALPVGELPADYTRKLAYGDDVTMGDRANALLGLF